MSDELKMSLKSMNISEEKKTQLKQLFPEAFTENKIDFERFKQVLGEHIETGRERYGMNWAGKSNCFKIIQEPSFGTLKPCKEESVNFDTSENIFIEGDNLEVLKLLQKSYYGKIKMIYIDPPYNTGNEFIYPDNFSESLDTYLKYTGQKDAEGKKFSTNVETDGRFHSKWMNMMYTRLYLARNLLKEDGSIFISINDSEFHNLKTLCNEIFGEENFIANLIWKSRQNVDSRNKSNVSNDHEYILVYSRDFNKFQFKGKSIDLSKYSNPDNDPRGPWMSNSILGLANAAQRPNLHYELEDPSSLIKFPCAPDSGWRYSKDTMAKKINENRIVFPKKADGRPREKKFLNELDDEFTGYSSILPESVGFTLNGSRELRDLLGGKYFDFPKPTNLLETLIEQGTSSDGNDLVLDFFAGSGTTAQSVLAINKREGKSLKFILVQLPEPLEAVENSEKKYLNISEITKDRIRKFIRVINEDGVATSIGFKCFKLFPSNFKIWDINHNQNLAENLPLFEDHVVSKSTQEEILFEILIKSGFELTTQIQKLIINDCDIYSIENGAMYIYLGERISLELTYAIAEKEPSRFVCLDRSFHYNDQLKTNTVQLMKSRNIEFRTV